MQNSYSSLEEISSLESFVITSHISSYHHKMMYGLPKNFKKIVKMIVMKPLKLMLRRTTPLLQVNFSLIDHLNYFMT